MAAETTLLFIAFGRSRTQISKINGALSSRGGGRLGPKVRHHQERHQEGNEDGQAEGEAAHARPESPW